MYGVAKDAHSSFPFHISTGSSKVEPEIDISNVTSNEIDDKCTFKILCVNFFRITYAAVLRVKYLTITSTNNYIGYCINYLQVGFFYLIH